jgi:hypothetical protein
LTNDSPSPVTIAQVDADCGCAAPARTYEGALVAPGASATIDFLLNVGFDTGARERKLRVALQSGEILTSVVRLAVVGAYSVSEQAIDFGDIDLADAEPVRRGIRFLSTSTKLLDVRTEYDWMTASVSSTPEGAEVVAEVRRNRADIGVSYGGLLLLTSDADRPTFRVSVRVNGVAPLMPVPSTVYLSSHDTMAVEFVDRSVQRVAITSCQAEPGPLRAEVLPDGRLAVTAGDAWRAGARVRVCVRDDSNRAGFVSVYALVN